MGLIRLFSRQIVFGIGRKVEVNLRQKLFDHLLIQDPEWIQKKGVETLLVELQAMLKT